MANMFFTVIQITLLRLVLHHPISLAVRASRRMTLSAAHLPRSWEKLFMVLQEGQLLAYKDQRASKQSPDSMAHGESPLELRDAKAAVATDYSKKKHVFRLK